MIAATQGPNQSLGESLGESRCESIRESLGESLPQALLTYTNAARAGHIDVPGNKNRQGQKKNDIPMVAATSLSPFPLLTSL